VGEDYGVALAGPVTNASGQLVGTQTAVGLCETVLTSHAWSHAPISSL
jgi:hypothetical protein